METIRRRVEGPGPTLTLISGPPGVGKSTLTLAALEGREALRYRAAPLPDPDHRSLLARRARAFLGAREGTDGTSGAAAPRERPDRGDGSLPADAGWPELLEAVSAQAHRLDLRTVVVLDGWDRLVQARPELPRELVDFWTTVRRRSVPLHLVLVSRPGGALEPFREGAGPLHRWTDAHLRVQPLPYRAVTDRVESGGRRERLLTYAVFGGWPEAVGRIDPSRSARENARELLFRPDAPLLRWGIHFLEREVQAPRRYAAVLRALAMGAREWGSIRRAVPGIGTSGQMAPYLQRLEEMGLVRVTRSLDAEPTARRRRYELVDPFPAFWFRFVLPHLSEVEMGDGEGEAEALWARAVEPALDDHLLRLLPGVCREYLRGYAGERVPAPAEEVGALWGPGYDLDAAGALADGSAFFGKVVRPTRPGPREANGSGDAVPAAAGAQARSMVVSELGADAPRVREAVSELDEEVARTSYGFWRKVRRRFLFTPREVVGAPARGGDPLIFSLADLLDG